LYFWDKTFWVKRPEATRKEAAEMATVKRVLRPDRIREVPRAFSWIDHRLVRDGHISRCTHEALALYLFLVTVADAQGLSYYSDSKAAGLLNMCESTLSAARRELRAVGLIAYRYPLYQVLSLEDPAAGLTAVCADGPRRGSGEAVSIGEVLRQAIGGVR
jgi:hypothetical protein